MKSLRVVFGSIATSITLALLRANISLAQVQSVRSGIEATRSGDEPRVLLGEGGIFETAVDLLLFVVGAVAVVMIIFGGFRYVISGGNAASVTAAKNTILYAIVGVVIALLAYAIIDFVVASLVSDGAAGL